jgi:hypothetical protein
MMLIKNLERHSLPPLRRISSRDSKLQEGIRKGFLDRDVTHRVKLVWLPLKKQVLAVSTLNYSEVLILMLEIWATTYEMPGLSTIVAQTGWKVSVVWTSLCPLPRGYQDRLLGGPLGLPDLRSMALDGVKHKDYRGEVLG